MTMTPAAAQVRARFAVKHGQPVPPEVVGVLLAEYDDLRAMEQRVRALHSPNEYGDCPACGLSSYEEAMPHMDCPTIAALGERP